MSLIQSYTVFDTPIVFKQATQTYSQVLNPILEKESGQPYFFGYGTQKNIKYIFAGGPKFPKTFFLGWRGVLHREWGGQLEALKLIM